MTKEEAIYIMMNSNEYHHAKGELPHSALSIEAFNMAIEALKERPHGEWIKKTEGLPHLVTIEWFVCSKCGVQKSEGTPFCPWCGASMVKEGDE